MRNARRTGRQMVTAILIAVTGACVLAGTAGAQEGSAEQVPVLDLDGVVDPFLADYIEHGIEVANGDDPAPAVMIEIDTPGGLDSSMRQITQAILNSKVPVICYVSPQGARAASAGAFVLLSCPVAAMAPGTNVGAATPVGLSGAIGSDKAVNDAAAYIRSLAETYGRNADMAESFVRSADSITAEAALSADVIDVIAPTAEQLLVDIDGRQVRLGDGTTTTLDTQGWVLEDEPMGGFIGFLHSLLDPNLAFIFFWVGLALVVLELLVPGHVFSGTIGTILLILSVVSFGLLPVELVGIALLIAAVVLMIVELHAPGFGIWGFAGLACLVLGGWFLYDRSQGVSVSPAVIATVAIFVGAFFFLVLTKVLKMRHMAPAQGPEVVVGKEGVVIGRGLDPKGIVRVASEEWKATTSDGSSLPAGARVVVTRLDGLALTVDAANDEGATAGTAPAEGGRNT
ncbi:MAG TPA: nodulation protein NfeD [Actinomycetota bacterium]|nr:nodulation protein NfeD [Actinomycetota bacterium]